MPKRLALAQAPGKAAACCTPKSRSGEASMATFAPLFKALGDETRLDILSYLAAAEDATCVCHIEDYVKDLSQPTISHHLRLLREAGLVTTERRGTWVHYAIAPALRERLADFLALLPR
jgi:ArsR family transcriptional regulator